MTWKPSIEDIKNAILASADYRPDKISFHHWRTLIIAAQETYDRRFTCHGSRPVMSNDPQECNWPICGCDQYAGKVIAALQEQDLLKEKL